MNSVQQAPELSAKCFAIIREIVETSVGIQLTEDKANLVESRLAPRLRKLKLDSYDDYCNLLRGPASRNELVLLLDSISTNVTSFFRERAGLDILANEHAQGMAQGKRKFRYWSAASSTGEEAYSLAMLLAEVGDNPGIDTAILATDISTKVLAHGKAGRYGSRNLSDMDPNLRAKYFIQDPSNKDVFQIIPALRDLVTFNRLNLIKPPYPMQGKFDAILCRNVMIYFDQETRDALTSRLIDYLHVGGNFCRGPGGIGGRPP